MPRDARLVADVLAAHRRLDAVGADQEAAAVLISLGVETQSRCRRPARRAGTLVPVTTRMRSEASAAFEQRAMRVGAMDHRVRKGWRSAFEMLRRWGMRPTQVSSIASCITISSV